VKAEEFRWLDVQRSPDLSRLFVSTPNSRTSLMTLKCCSPDAKPGRLSIFAAYFLARSQASFTREPRRGAACSRIWQARVRCGASVAARCKPEGAAPANATLIKQKNMGRFLRATGFQWNSFRGGSELAYLNPLVAAKETPSAFVSSLFSFSLSAQKSRVHLMSLLQV